MCALLELCNGVIFLGKQATPFLASLYKTGVLILSTPYSPSWQVFQSNPISLYLGHYNYMYYSNCDLIRALCNGVHSSEMLPLPVGSIPPHPNVPEGKFSPTIYFGQAVMFYFLTVNHFSATLCSLLPFLPQTLHSNSCNVVITVPQWFWFSCEVHFYVLYLTYQDPLLINHFSCFYLFFSKLSPVGVYWLEHLPAFGFANEKIPTSQFICISCVGYMSSHYFSSWHSWVKTAVKLKGIAVFINCWEKGTCLLFTTLFTPWKTTGWNSSTVSSSLSAAG